MQPLLLRRQLCKGIWMKTTCTANQHPRNVYTQTPEAGYLRRQASQFDMSGLWRSGRGSCVHVDGFWGNMTLDNSRFMRYVASHSGGDKRNRQLPHIVQSIQDVRDEGQSQ